jgi:hypothetical protein
MQWVSVIILATFPWQWVSRWCHLLLLVLLRVNRHTLFLLSSWLCKDWILVPHLSTVWDQFCGTWCWRGRGVLDCDRCLGLGESVSEEDAMATGLSDGCFSQAMARKRDWYANVTNDVPLQVIPVHPDTLCIHASTILNPLFQLTRTTW